MLVPARGVLDPQAEHQGWSFGRFHPSNDLADLIEHHWTVAWDLAGRLPDMQETLPHPSIHLVFESDQAWIHGVVTGRFARPLIGRGRVVAVKFRPGAFRPFLKASVSTLTDHVIPATEVFGPSVTALARCLRGLEEDAAVALAEDLIRRHRPPEDSNVELAGRIAEGIARDRSALKVDDVARRWGLSVRTLQRLFREYVGVGPKWVIKRYRLHEAVERAAAPDVTWPDVARDLGYADQAHLIHDFTTIVGRSPATYAREATRGAGPPAQR
jgi:AraC-like DNA-binding protein